VIRYIKGDLFTTECELLAHGCNCRGGFGSGVAGQVARLYPHVRESYQEKYQRDGWKLGEIQIIEAEPKRWIANCATQDRYGGLIKDEVFADYQAIHRVMTQLNDEIRTRGWRLAMPKIGAGLANGDWTRIEAIIESVFTDQPVDVYYL
jgi:O-acetyl-ADP-ribose deacetylase (regulator of RNase III)